MFISQIFNKPGDGISVVNFIDIIIDDQFRLNDIRVIKTAAGKHHLIFPSRKICKKCICGVKNKQSARFCNDCGVKLIQNIQEYADIFFPLCVEARKKMEDTFLAKYKGI